MGNGGPVPRHDGFQVRAFMPESDNAGVLEVARSLEIPARVRLGIDRSPDFTAFDRALGEPYEILVAQAGGEVIGFLEMCACTFRVAGRECRAVHAALGGVRPDWRRCGVSTALRTAGFERALRMGAEWAYLLVNARNRIMQQALRRAYADLVALERLLVHAVVFRWSPPVGHRGSPYRIEVVDETDWPQLLDFLHERTRGCDIVPQLDAMRLRALPGLGPSSFHAAKDASGRIVACLGSWDPSPFKRALVLGYGPLERALMTPLNLMMSSAGLRPLPRAGEPLRTLYTLCPHAAPGHERALRRMIDALRRDSRDCHAVLVAFPEGDRRNGIVSRFAHFTNVNIPFLVPLTREFAAEWRIRPPRTIHIEYALV